MFPDGEDPDSYARSHRSSEVQHFITNTAANFIYFKTNLLLGDAGSDPVKKAGLINEIVGSIALIPDQIIRGVYVKECAALMDMEEITLINQLNRVRRQIYNKRIKEKTGQDPVVLDQKILPSTEPKIDFDYLSSEPLEKNVIRLLITYGDQVISFAKEDEKESDDEWDVASWIIQNIQQDDIPFGKNLYQKVIAIVSKELEDGNIPASQYYLNHPEIEIAEFAAGILSSKYELNDWGRVKVHVTKEEDLLKVAVVQSIFSLKLREIEKQYDRNLKKMKSVPESEIESFMVLQQNLMKKKNLLSAELGRIVLR